MIGWSAPDAEQDGLRRAFLTHLDLHPGDGWSRDCPGAHLTASSLICRAGSSGTEVLLTLHATIGRWLQTGGHLESGDVSLAGAALREAGEESGIAGLDLDPVPVLLSRHRVRCGPVDPCHHLDVQYLVRASAGVEAVRSAESADLRWFSAEDHPAEPTVSALIAAAQRRLGRSETSATRDRGQER